MLTIYDSDNDELVQVEEPDPSAIYTYADYMGWKFRERLELFRGRIFKMGAPNTKHQVIAGNLFYFLKSFLRKATCQAFIAPFDVRLPVRSAKKDNEVTTVVQPDVFAVCDPSKIDARGVCGAPDIVVEVLSPGNSEKEIKFKFDLYQEAGVREYWIIYPEEQSAAIFILNEEGKYDGAKLYSTSDEIASIVLPGFIVKLSDIVTN